MWIELNRNVSIQMNVVFENLVWMPNWAAVGNESDKNESTSETWNKTEIKCKQNSKWLKRNWVELVCVQNIKFVEWGRIAS